MLGEDGQVGLVGERHPDIHLERLAQDLAERLVAPAEVGCDGDHAVAPPDDADDRHTTPTRLSSDGRRPRRSVARSARTVAMSATLERLRGRSTRTRSKTSPPRPTAAAASESTAISRARTTAPFGSARTTGDGRPGVPSSAAGPSKTSRPATSSPISPADGAAGQPACDEPERDRGPLAWSSRTMALRLARRTVSLR